MEDQYIFSIDQGTSSSRVLVFSSRNGEILASHQIPLICNYPSPGWVEVDACLIYDITLKCINKCVEQLQKSQKSIKNVIGMGITNQRETIVAWARNTGKPLAPAIVWSDARTSDLVSTYITKLGGNPDAFKTKTGLPLHSYFSALKIHWLLENVPAVRDAERNQNLLVGTIDSWLIWCLTKNTVHVTDVTNASRTLLFNITTLKWDDELCQFFGINPRILPKVISSAEVVCVISDPKCLLSNVKICGILGDQQASLVAQIWSESSSPSKSSDQMKSAITNPTIKITFGTGAFLLWDIGLRPLYSNKGILTTIAYKMGPQAEVHYALEGAVSFAGATMEWLRTKLGLFNNFDECEKAASSHLQRQNPNVVDSCYLVPAFTGLFCPWWQECARTVLCGVTADVDKTDIIYAGLRSTVYQTYDVLKAATYAEPNDNTGLVALNNPREIMVDGGMTNSATIMQSLADILDVVVRHHNHSDMMTALGAAIAVAMALKIEPSGLLKLRHHPQSNEERSTAYTPRITQKSRQVMLSGWHAAVERSFAWTTDASSVDLDDKMVDLFRKTNTSKRPICAHSKPITSNTVKLEVMSNLPLSLATTTIVAGISVLCGLIIGRLM